MTSVTRPPRQASIKGVGKGFANLARGRQRLQSPDHLETCNKVFTADADRPIEDIWDDAHCYSWQRLLSPR